MRALTGIALAVVALAGGGAPAAGAAGSLPPRDPAWWSPDASLRLLPPPVGSGPLHADFDAGFIGWKLVGPGRVDVRAGGPAHHYAAIRDNTTLVADPWTVPGSAQIVTLWARGLHQQEALRVGAMIDGRLVVLGTIAPSLSWRRYALPAAPIHGRSVSLVLDPVMPFGDGIDVAAVGRTQAPARGFVFDVGAATRLAGGPDGAALAVEPGDFLLRGAAFRVPGDATTVSLWMRAQGGATPQVSVDAGAQELGRATPGAHWAPLRLDATSLRGQSIRLRVQADDAAGLQLALIGTVQRAPRLVVAKASRDPKAPGLMHIVVRGPTGLAGQAVTIEVRRAGADTYRTAATVRLNAAGRAPAALHVPLRPTAIRLLYAGDEAFSPFVSVPRPVHRAPKNP